MCHAATLAWASFARADEVSSAGQSGWRGYSVAVTPGSVALVSVCSFCGKTVDEVGGRLVTAGTTDIAICEECVQLCVQIFEE